jgi:hypothetical protein
VQKLELIGKKALAKTGAKTGKEGKAGKKGKTGKKRNKNRCEICSPSQFLRPSYSLQAPKTQSLLTLIPATRIFSRSSTNKVMSKKTGSYAKA